MLDKASFPKGRFFLPFLLIFARGACNCAVHCIFLQKLSARIYVYRKGGVLESSLYIISSLVQCFSEVFLTSCNNFHCSILNAVLSECSKITANLYCF